LLVGQILNSREPAVSPAAIPVTLLKGRKVLAQSSTNAFGEFQMTCDLQPSLQLKVELPGEADICISLVEPTSEELPGRLDAHPATPPVSAARTKKSTRKKV
jgi:hypothetical protein